MVTPTNRPSAHDVSVMPITRPLRSNGTRSDTHAPSARSNITLLWAMTMIASVKNVMWLLAAASSAPTPTPPRPTTMAVRRCRRSASRPVSGEANPDSSLIANATPMRSSETRWPAAMVARNGGANRKHAFAHIRAVVSNETRRRTSSW